VSPEAAFKPNPSPTAPPPPVPTAPRQPFRMVAISVEDEDQRPKTLWQTFETLRIAVEVELLGVGHYHVGVAIVRNDRENVFGTSTHFGPEPRPLTTPGRHRLTLELPKLPLLSGDYALSVYALDNTGLQVFDMAEGVCPFRVHNPGEVFGLVHLDHRWLAP
ncbi:MAG: Wzt carbohydrate-binding domain-containing protein, partial [Candidatus Competibacterales bacterium]